MTADYLPLPCPVYGEARGTSECEKCHGDIVRCPIYGPAERRTICHICGKRNNEPGEVWCSAGHPLPASVAPHTGAPGGNPSPSGPTPRPADSAACVSEARDDRGFIRDTWAYRHHDDGLRTYIRDAIRHARIEDTRLWRFNVIVRRKLERSRG